MLLKKVIQHVTGTTAVYNIKIGLTTRSKDLGWFDTYDGVNTVLPQVSFPVTGTSTSRLSELRKYTVSGTVSDLYFTSTGSTHDGVNISLTNSGVTASTYVYYLGGITYKDVIIGSASTTTFLYQSLGLTDPNNFDNKPYIKLESKENVVENPFINSDVFIIRQEIPVFEKSIRLRGVNSLNDIIAYAGGNYFTIYNNT